MGRLRDLRELQETDPRWPAMAYFSPKFKVIAYFRISGYVLGLKSTLSVDDKLNVKQSQY